MYELRTLMDGFWVTKADDREKYYEMKRFCARKDVKHLLVDLLGWNLVVNESVIKLEKVPPKAQPWMGIQSFTDPMDYCLLCAMLLYLSDLDDGEQFLLSSLTEAVEAFTKEFLTVDWTRFVHRKSMVRVLKFAQQLRLILVYDGSTENFGTNREQEVLYENTGLSRHFPVHFGRDILHCDGAEDLEALFREGTDRGRRVYQMLALTPAVYWSQENREEYDYIKNQRPYLSKVLSDALGGELHVHRNGAFFAAVEDQRFGLLHPRDLALSDAVLMVCGRLREKIVAVVYPLEADDTCRLSKEDFYKEILACRADWGDAWGKGLRQEPEDSFLEKVTQYMRDWMLIALADDTVTLYPAVGAFVGAHPADYKKETQEETNGTVENV